MLPSYTLRTSATSSLQLRTSAADYLIVMLSIPLCFCDYLNLFTPEQLGIFENNFVLQIPHKLLHCLSPIIMYFHNETQEQVANNPKVALVLSLFLFENVAAVAMKI